MHNSSKGDALIGVTVRRLLLRLILLPVLFSMLIISSKISAAEASDTIYIRSDGSIDPSTASITSLDNVTYHLTGDVSDPIVVERDNIVIDGLDHRIQGVGSGTGMSLSGRNNVTIRRVEISSFYYGLQLYNSSGNNIRESNITGNSHGISLTKSRGNHIIENNITSNTASGIHLHVSHNNILRGNGILGNEAWGVRLYSSCCNDIIGNDFRSNEEAIELRNATSNIVAENIMSGNWRGIGFLWITEGNVISGNSIVNNQHGVWFYYTQTCENQFYHNNFINNTYHRAGDELGGPCDLDNAWDRGYPAGGNYWSDHSSSDQHHGSYQNVSGGDGIADDSYEIAKDIIDYYPLIGVFHDFATDTGYDIYVVSNSTIESVAYTESNSTIKMLVSNSTGDQSSGFCQVTILRALLSPPYTVTVDYSIVSHTTIYENETLTIIYFNYPHSRHEVIIVPEFVSVCVLLIALMATLLTIVICRTRTERLLGHLD